MPVTPSVRVGCRVVGMRIFALSVSGGILAICPLPGRDGDYAGDMAHLYEWAPAIVLSLTTEVELLVAKAQSLGPDLQTHGTRWVHLPIEDMQAPDAAFAQHWQGFSQTARRALAGGGRVLVHCHGGCGRSGMIALRLMIEVGDDPQTALTRLRTVRPCAIETKAQMAWAVDPAV